MREESKKAGCGVLVVIALIASFILTPYVCTDAEGAAKTLADSGYTNISITGHAWFQCSKDDFYSTGFAATGPAGRPVIGTVCKGVLFKASTIRLD